MVAWLLVCLLAPLAVVPLLARLALLALLLSILLYVHDRALLLHVQPTPHLHVHVVAYLACLLACSALQTHLFAPLAVVGHACVTCCARVRALVHVFACSACSAYSGCSACIAFASLLAPARAWSCVAPARAPAHATPNLHVHVGLWKSYDCCVYLLAARAMMTVLA